MIYESYNPEHANSSDCQFWLIHSVNRKANTAGTINLRDNALRQRPRRHETSARSQGDRKVTPPTETRVSCGMLHGLGLRQSLFCSRGPWT